MRDYMVFRNGMHMGTVRCGRETTAIQLVLGVKSARLVYQGSDGGIATYYDPETHDEIRVSI